MCAVAALAVAGTARAAPVAVVVSAPFALERYASAGAVGLVVPGAGSTVTREGALAALVRGQVRNALVDGRPSGEPLIELAERPGPVTIYVSLPPAGRTHNVRRYPIAIVGGGYHGLLVSSATRIPGLVSIADVAPTAVAIAGGERPRIGSRPGNAPPALRRLDQRLTAAHDARFTARAIVACLLLLAFAVAVALRSRRVARAGLLVAPALLTAALVLAAAHEARLAIVIPVLAGGGAVALLAGRLGDRFAAAAVVAFLVAQTIVLAWKPELNSLAVIGPHPDGGGRYYGITNEVETLLLAPTLAAAAVLGPVAAVPAFALVGWSRAGADGGGLLVFAAALAVLWLVRSERHLTARRLVLGAALAVLAALLVVGIDAATGGSSHVLSAVGDGPSSWLAEATHRWRVSWAGATSSSLMAAESLGGLAGLVVFAIVRPRSALVDAFLVGIAVSLVVNDTPQDVLAFGALSCGSLLVWERLGERGRRR